MIRVNGEVTEILDESIADLITRLHIEPRGIAVAVDGEVIQHSMWASTRVLDESSIEIVTAAAGG